MSESEFVVCANADCKRKWDPNEQDYTSFMLRCPDCGYLFTEQYLRGTRISKSKKYLYLIEAGNGAVKIGISANPKKRLDDLQTANSSRLKLRAIAEPSEPKKMEKTLHEKYEEANVRGEWFNLSESDIGSIIEFVDPCAEVDGEPPER